MNKLFFLLIFICYIYTQQSICANPILNQNSLLLNRSIECQENQFKIRKNVLQTSNSDYFFECVDFIFIESFSDSNTHLHVEESEYNNNDVPFGHKPYL